MMPSNYKLAIQYAEAITTQSVMLSVCRRNPTWRCHCFFSEQQTQIKDVETKMKVTVFMATRLDEFIARNDVMLIG